MAPPHTAIITTSKASSRPALPKRPVILSQIPFKARLTPPHPAFNCSDENMIKLYIRVQEGEAMKRLRLKEAKIREVFRTKEEELLENFRQERDVSKTLDGVSESLAKMEIDRNLLKEEGRRSQQGCNAVLPRKHHKKSADRTIQDDEMEFRNNMPPYGDQSSHPSNVVMKDGKENDESYPTPSRGGRKDTVMTPGSTFPPPTNRTKPNEGTKNTPPVSDTRYSLITLEQDLATSTNIEPFFFERPPLFPITPTADNSLRSKLRISNFKSDFPGLSSKPHKIIDRSHSPGQQQPLYFFSDESDESGKENLDHLAILRQQQQQHLLFATPVTAHVASAQAKQNSYISSCSAPCSPRGRKREHDDFSDDLDGGMTTTTTPSMDIPNSPAAKRIRGLVTSSIAIPQPLANHDSQQHSPNADISMIMEQESQVKRARILLSPPARLESFKPSLLLRDPKGLFGRQSMIIR